MLQVQVLWKRGFADESKVKHYKTNNLDDVGNVVPEFLLGHMI
jgi:hypothetical protein